MTKSAYDYDCAFGCAKIYVDPKLHEYDECFGGSECKIRMSDIDGVVERNGYVLFVEWKSDIPSENSIVAQIKLHQALTGNSRKHVSIWIVGNPKTMAVYHVRVMRNGAWESDWQATTREDLKARFRRWFETVNARRAVVA